MFRKAKRRLKVCIDRALPGESPFELRGHDARARAAALRNKMWEPAGRTLRIRFLDGDPVVQKKVAKFAQEWTQYANLKLDFNDDPKAEIRVSFLQPGSWSYIGTDAIDPQLAPDQPTMNLGWLTKATRNDEVFRVVLHEFGHALGLIHEHQNPVATIPWNKPAVYDFMKDRRIIGPRNRWTSIYSRSTTKKTPNIQNLIPIRLCSIRSPKSLRWAVLKSAGTVPCLTSTSSSFTNGTRRGSNQ